MDATKAEIINQIRELNALLIQAKLHVGRSKLAHHFHRGELDSDIPELHGHPMRGSNQKAAGHRLAHGLHLPSGFTQSA